MTHVEWITRKAAGQKQACQNLAPLIGVATNKNWGPKWTSEVNDQQNSSGFIYMVLKSRDYVFKVSVFKKLSIILYGVHWYMFMFILKS